MTMGPVEYLVIGFEGNHFTGEILPELRSLRERGLIRIIDLLFVQKDQAGRATIRELSELSAEEARAYDTVTGDLVRMLTEEDVENVARGLPHNSSEAILLLEHVWATHLRDTIQRANGRLLDSGLIPAADVEAVSAQLAAEQAQPPMH